MNLMTLDDAPSWTNWWALQINFRSFISINLWVTDSPNNHPAPRGLTAKLSISSGSDHTRSQNAPRFKNKFMVLRTTLSVSTREAVCGFLSSKTSQFSAGLEKSRISNAYCKQFPLEQIFERKKSNCYWSTLLYLYTVFPDFVQYFEFDLRFADLGIDHREHKILDYL